METFDAIVIGGGHAGVEATRALCAKGLRTALITLDASRIGDMSCNPAIGGVAKSHLVYEIDALGGLMGACADQTGLQARRLNLKKGPAVRATRVQCDKFLYTKTMSGWFGSLSPKLKIIQGEAAEILFSGASTRGVLLVDGSTLLARSVIVTAGTFMRGLMFCGEERSVGGRYGDKAADRLTESIVNSGHKIKRLKTGTPARLKAESIDFSKLEKQWGDPEQRRFSWRERTGRLPQLACYMTYTSERTHDVIRKNFSKSPLFSGEIQGVGPRYCPSVEDKVKRFPERTRHQVFLEPEGLTTNSIYPNGLSTSLPPDVQLEFLRSISGLESVELLRPGYAVEYDSIDPTQLKYSFMSSLVEGLFFAGQVNRTSGYEEAAAQGLWAGINAGLFLSNEETLIPQRGRSYIETLVSDLVEKGTEEPYRLFTSRSEYRLLLREDNAHDRLHSLATRLGLVSEEQKKWYSAVSVGTELCKQRLLQKKQRLSADKVITLFEYLKRPEITWEDLAADLDDQDSDLALERVEIDAKYSGYIQRQEAELRQLADASALYIDYRKPIADISSLSREDLEKVFKTRPKTIADLARISGITPSAVLAISKFASMSTPDGVSRETN